MLKQAMDFKMESDSLHQLLQTLDEKTLEQTTQFKGWTINDIIQHLHFFNYAAVIYQQTVERYPWETPAQALAKVL